MRLPKALGMLIGGLLLRNLPGAGGPNNLLPPIAMLNPDASRLIRAGAMALVLVRSGLSLDMKTIMGYGWTMFVFATLPTIIEASIGAAVASALFGMPYILAMCMSFMIAAVVRDMHMHTASCVCAIAEVACVAGPRHHRGRLLLRQGARPQVRCAS